MNSSTELVSDIGESRAFQRRLEAIDWDFSAQLSESPFSWLHWHPCRFPSQLPSLLISRLSTVGDTVLDPFAGSATTLVEAQRLGRFSIGIDINPVSVLIAKSKTLACSYKKIERYIDTTIIEIERNWNQTKLADVPDSVQQKKWYTTETLRGLRKLWTLLERDSDPITVISKAAFSSILLACCREERHWGYICDNTEPKSVRSADAKALFLKALYRFKLAYRSRDHEMTGLPCSSKVIEGDAAKRLRSISDASIDCIVTSPPYFGVADYVKAQRLSTEWFSIDIETFRLQEIGARSKRRRSSAASEYIKDMKEAFAECYRVLKSGGHVGVVYGQSPKREDLYGTLLNDLLETGFVKVLEKSRRVALSRRMIASLSDEVVLILRKP